MRQIEQQYASIGSGGIVKSVQHLKYFRGYFWLWAEAGGPPKDYDTTSHSRMPRPSFFC